MLLPLMPFSLRNLDTVVWWRSAISLRVSPFLMVTFFERAVRFLLLLLLDLLLLERLLWLALLRLVAVVVLRSVASYSLPSMTVVTRFPSVAEALAAWLLGFSMRTTWLLCTT